MLFLSDIFCKYLFYKILILDLLLSKHSILYLVYLDDKIINYSDDLPQYDAMAQVIEQKDTHIGIFQQAGIPEVLKWISTISTYTYLG